MPEEEYYTSQVVRNRKSYFETPKEKLFTQSFLPLEGEIKGTVYCTGADEHVRLRWMFQKICMSFSTWGYAVFFAANLLGHGRSNGIRCYMGDMKKVAATSLSFFKHVRCSDPYIHLPAFLFGESMGVLLNFSCTFSLSLILGSSICYPGLIFSAPLFVIPEDMKPSKPHLFAYGLLFGLADTWTAMPDNKMVGKAIHYTERLKIIASNPQRYTGKPRVRTMREILRKTQYVQENFGRVIIPLMTVHGTYDGVTCPSSSTLLYEKASSADKTLKLYDGMYHSLIQGEPDENAAIVFKDMREWIDERVKRY
ncbi:hypothetical protein Bca52824_081485 [Brassica carinata]|uniref:Serine aminopeptidase S33 domain-containing protein n=1 Tax=Brassica carinata TaxID=52824 RepID=A0A8X7PKM0_BRACI|nr:hypothetical protein Bca52824_081485 [Brassica carinata]